MNIIMGNDEFILYLRKRNIECQFDNDHLGRIIWENIQKMDSHARIIERDMDCMWGSEGKNIAADKLPQTATQFEFNRDILVDIYNYLDSL
jgi:hypothetical protein